MSKRYLGQSSATGFNLRKTIQTLIGGSINSHLLYQYQVASGTAGPSYSATAWRTVPFNTEVADVLGIGSLASNQITIPAGTYEFHAAALLYGQNIKVASRLYDTTNTAVLGRGVNDFFYLPQGGYRKNGQCVAHGRFVVTGEVDIEYQLYPSAASEQPTAASSGSVEVYSSLMLSKVA